MTRRLYTGKDFATVESEMKSRLARKFPGITLDFENDLTQVLIQMHSFGGENLNFFGDVRINEAFVPTAQRRSSLERLSAAHAYNARGAVSAAGEVTMRLSPAVAQTVLIPRGFGFSASNGLFYETTDQITIPPNDGDYREITLSEGETQTAVFRSDGSRFQRFDLSAVSDDKYCSWRSALVLVDGEEWTEVDQIADLDTNVYRVGYKAQPPYIEFGDGAAGSVPVDGGEISIEFRITSGEGGVAPVDTVTSSPVNELVVAGNAVSFEFLAGTGEMTGGQDPESASSIRTNMPKFHHSDGAYCVVSDLLGLSLTFRDALYGGPAVVSAVLATSLNNDLTAVGILTTLKARFTDADATVASAASSLLAVETAINADTASIRTRANAIITEAGPTGSIVSSLGAVETSRLGINTAANSINDGADATTSALVTVDSSEDAVRAIVAAITPGAGPNALTTADYNAIIAALDEINTRVSPGGTISAQQAAIQGSVSTIKSLTASIQTEADTITGSTTDIDAEADLIILEATAIDATATGITTQANQLVVDLQDPWDDALNDIASLEAHLDDVFTDVCGPNVISVPIMSTDTDGFYAAPSVGLMRGLESFIMNGRNEPSVIFRVVSGAGSLVLPTITITFQAEEGYSAVKLKALIESNLLVLLKGRAFDDDLYLDDLYGSVRLIEGIKFLNITIDGFTGGRGDAEIDLEGNLFVSDKEVITRGIMNYFRRFPDGSKEAI